MPLDNTISTEVRANVLNCVKPFIDELEERKKEYAQIGASIHDGKFKGVIYAARQRVIDNIDNIVPTDAISEHSKTLLVDSFFEKYIDDNGIHV